MKQKKMKKCIKNYGMRFFTNAFYNKTMNRNIALAKRIRVMLLDGQWIANTNYKQEIQNTTWQQAVHKIGSLNTIAALAYHINYYLPGLLCALENCRLEISDKYGFDLPKFLLKQIGRTL